MLLAPVAFATVLCLALTPVPTVSLPDCVSAEVGPVDVSEVSDAVTPGPATADQALSGFDESLKPLLRTSSL